MGKRVLTYQPPKLFYADLACKYGLDVSVFVTELSQLIESYADQKNWNPNIPPQVETLVVNGLTYAPFTLSDLEKEFPWWSNRQIQLIKGKAQKVGLLKQEYFNADPRNRTLWYAVDLGG